MHLPSWVCADPECPGWLPMPLSACCSWELRLRRGTVVWQRQSLSYLHAYPTSSFPHATTGWAARSTRTCSESLGLGAGRVRSDSRELGVCALQPIKDVPASARLSGPLRCLELGGLWEHPQLLALASAGICSHLPAPLALLKEERVPSPNPNYAV